jgi:hypothetical protein
VRWQAGGSADKPVTRSPDNPVSAPFLLIGPMTEYGVITMDMARQAGAELHHSPDAIGVEKMWSSAPLVFVDEAAFVPVRRQWFPRRPGVVLLTGRYSLAIWHLVEALGASYLAVWPGCRSWLAEQFAATVRD